MAVVAMGRVVHKEHGQGHRAQDTEHTDQCRSEQASDAMINIFVLFAIIRDYSDSLFTGDTSSNVEWLIKSTRALIAEDKPNTDDQI